MPAEERSINGTPSSFVFRSLRGFDRRRFLRDYAVFARERVSERTSERTNAKEMAFRLEISCRRTVGVVFPFEIVCRHGSVAQKERIKEEKRQDSPENRGNGGRSRTSGSRLRSNDRKDLAETGTPVRVE